MRNRAGKTRMAERQGAKWNKSVDIVQLWRGKAYNMVSSTLPGHHQRSIGAEKTGCSSFGKVRSGYCRCTRVELIADPYPNDSDVSV